MEEGEKEEGSGEQILETELCLHVTWKMKTGGIDVDLKETEKRVRETEREGQVGERVRLLATRDTVARGDAAIDQTLEVGLVPNHLVCEHLSCSYPMHVHGSYTDWLT